MKQVIQNIKSGDTEVVRVPAPACRPGHLLIASTASLVSVGTERMLLEFGRASIVGKIRQQPEKVRQVLDKVRTDGLVPTMEAVRAKLESPIPMGYSNVGTVLEIGDGVDGFRVGDRVVSNGPHAEIVCVPKNLCAKIPEGVTDETAVFTVLGAIALQGVRLAAPAIGEVFVVTGLGLIGLLTVQLLRANGCRVLGVDYDRHKLELARAFGAETVDLSQGEDPLGLAHALSRGRGVDGVLITASTKSSEPVHQAAQMCRKRGRIVLVGVAGLELRRSDFYEKELTFQVSCSYGPGRYDATYEERGNDYPVGFVRWTEQRNFEAVLDLAASGRVVVDQLITRRVPIESAPSVYAELSDTSALGILLTYPGAAESATEPRVLELGPRRSTGSVRVGVIGAGNYSSRILSPSFKEAGARLRAIASAGGLSATLVGRKLGFERSTTRIEEILEDRNINLIVVATRHDTHARLVCRALAAGKNVFVEKPLALTATEVDEVEAAHRSHGGLLMVGFNRRFSPHTARVVSDVASRPEPKAIIITVNAGAIPASSWVHDRTSGGGRILGEACHFIDLARHLAGAPISDMDARAAIPRSGANLLDTAIISLSFADGSIAGIHYLANGHPSVPKERIEVFQGGRVYRIDNFRETTVFGSGKRSTFKTRALDKGQSGCAAATVRAVQEGRLAPIPPDEIFEVARATVAAWEKIAGVEPVRADLAPGGA